MSAEVEDPANLQGPEEKLEAEQLDALRKTEDPGMIEETDIETSEARSATELSNWAQSILPHIGDTRRVSQLVV
jgi:hypothetical protein